MDVVRLLTNSSLAGQSKTSKHKPSSVIDYPECIEQQQAHKSHNHQVKDDMNSPILSELEVQRKVVNERGWPNFREVFMVSALLGDGMNDIKVTANIISFMLIYFTAYVAAIRILFVIGKNCCAMEGVCYCTNLQEG